MRKLNNLNHDLILLYIKAFLIIFILGYIFPLAIKYFISDKLNNGTHFNDSSIMVNYGYQRVKTYFNILIKMLQF